MCVKDSKYNWAATRQNLSSVIFSHPSVVFNIRDGCAKEPSHEDDSFVYPMLIFWLKI